MKKVLSILLVITTLFLTCVPAWAADASAVELDYAWLTRNIILRAGSQDATVLDNLALPEVGANGTTITWTSSDESVISNKGVVTRPELTKSVNLTATFENGESKVFAFRVPGKDVALDAEHPMPVKGELLNKDDFNDGSISSDITVSGNVTEANGKLNFKGAKGEALSAKFFVNNATTAATGDVIVEFTVYKNSIHSGLQIWTEALNGKDYGYFYSYSYGENEGNSLWLRGRSTDADGAFTKLGYTAFGSPSTTLKFTILYNTVAKTYKAWINNQFAVERNSMDNPDTMDIGTVTFFNINELATDFAIDDFACYKVKEETTGRVIVDEKFTSVPARAEIPANYTASVENGTLKLDPPDGYSSSKLYFNDGKAPLAGKFAVEFTISRSKDTDGVYAYFECYNTSTAKYAETIGIRNFPGTIDGMGTYIADLKGGSNAYVNHRDVVSNKLDVYAEFDTVAQTVKFKINDKIVREGYMMGDYTNISALKISSSSGTSNLTVSKFKVTLLDEGIENIKEHYVDSFSDGVADASLALSKNAVITEANGAMNVASGWFKKTFTEPIAEKFVAEISLIGTNTGGVHCYFNDANTYFGRVSWMNTGIVYVYNGGSSVAVNDVGTKGLHIKAVFDVPNDTFSVWINGKPAGTDLPCKKDAESIELFQLETGDATGINVDEVLFYSVKEDVPATVDALTFDYNAYDKKVTILSPEATDGVVVVASYKGNNLISAIPAEVELVENDACVAETKGLNVTGADRVAIFLWESLTNLTPICEAVPVTGLVTAN